MSAPWTSASMLRDAKEWMTCGGRFLVETDLVMLWASPLALIAPRDLWEGRGRRQP